MDKNRLTQDLNQARKALREEKQKLGAAQDQEKVRKLTQRVQAYQKLLREAK